MATYNGVPVPAGGQPIEYSNGKYRVPNRPIVPFIEGDGTGRDIWKASVRVFDAAVEKAYSGKRAVAWYEVFAGEKAKARFQNWLPDDTVSAIREFRVAIKGPLTTPVGGGIRSLNVALRQILDLYSCVRPVKYYKGVPSPVKHPERMDVVIFRENTEDVYAGIEWEQGTPDAARLIEFLNRDMLKGGKKQVRLDSGVGIKPISVTGTKRLVRMAIQHALENGRKTVTIVHKGNIQKFTEGAFRKWGYELATEEFRDKVVTERESWILDNKDKNPSLTVEQNASLIEPGLEFATDDFRQALYKEVKECLDSIYTSHGHGSSNIGDGYAIFEATHGTAPKYADKDVINPGSVMLSGMMMFRFLGWNEAADLIEQSLERTIEQKKVTYDFERLMEGATKVSTSEFASYIIENMGAAVATAAK